PPCGCSLHRPAFPSPGAHPGSGRRTVRAVPRRQGVPTPRATSHPDFHRRSWSFTRSTDHRGGRVADCHRRFGLSPTPEHVGLSLPVSHSRTSGGGHQPVIRTTRRLVRTTLRLVRTTLRRP